MAKILRCVLIASLPTQFFLLTVEVVKADIRFPDDSGMINIKAAPYNAQGNGVTDDTDAILRALRDWNASTTSHSSRPIYFPAGTYLVSDTLQAIDADGLTQSNVRILGQGESETIIKLADTADGYRDRANPRPVIATHGQDGNAGNWAFGNYIQHLTVDVGRGNPGAIGIDYGVSNWGSITDVSIRSSDDAYRGKYGVVFDDLDGAGYLRDVSIDGFDIGILAITAVNNIVLEDIELRNQRSAGIRNVSKNLAIRGLTSENSVPAIQLMGADAYLVLSDAVLGGGENDRSAIEMLGPAYLLAQNVRTSGYDLAIDSHESSPATDLIAGSEPVITEWLSHPMRTQLWEDASQSRFQLPVQQAPQYHTNDFSKWANVESFGAIANDGIDDSDAFQKAIDSGAEVIYFPFGRYDIDDAITVRGNVRKIDFLNSEVVGSGRFEIIDTTGDFVIMENLDTGLEDGPRRIVLHNSSKPLVLRHIGEAQWTVRNTDVAKELFIEDVGPWMEIHLSDGINAWMRQLNREWVPFTNDASNAWILGMNMEGKPNRQVPALTTTNGGVTEIVGGAIDPRIEFFESFRGAPFVVDNAALTLAIAGWASTGGYETVVAEIRGDSERTLEHDDLLRLSPRRIVVPPFRGSIDFDADFNDDQSLNAQDVDFLVSEIANAADSTVTDLNVDGLTDMQDLESWLGAFGTGNGDANLNGSVEFRDFLILAERFGRPGTWTQGDFDASGLVDFRDFLLLATNFGTSRAASVPEPCSRSLLTILALLVCVAKNGCSKCEQLKQPNEVRQTLFQVCSKYRLKKGAPSTAK